MSESALYRDGQRCYSPSRGRLSAGTFDANHYYGSISHDSFDEERLLIDQELIVLDVDWREICSWRPSSVFAKNNEYISNAIGKHRSFVAFRDPAKMPDGGIAVCTGGHRWNTFGNVCQMELSENGIDLARETILHKSMLGFREIERISFWEEWMFFSVNGGSSVIDPSSRYIHVAKKNRSGEYAYHSIVANSWMCYGPNVSNDLKLLFWFKGVFRINSPRQQNLFYRNGSWRLSWRAPRHLYWTTRAASPLLSREAMRAKESAKRFLTQWLM